MADNRPIGILDSGIGGLTIARAVTERLPHEQIIFFGDTAHLPYGDKSTVSIRHFVNRISDFLIDKGCKAILIACNSASAAAYSTLNKKIGRHTPVINVIDPIVEYVVNNYKFKKIGIIGTKRTVTSRVYPRRFEAANPKLDINSLATPLLAPMIEEGFFKNNISQTVINAYLSNYNLKDIEALVLACTHYPLIKQEIKQYYADQGQDVKIIDSTDVIAQYTEESLKNHNLLTSENAVPSHHFYVSDFTQSFQRTTNIFFGQAIKLEHASIWEKE